MYRILVATFVSFFCATSMLAQGSPVTYILEVSSNLNCDTLNIELISKADDSVQYLKYTTSAFAAISLPLGRHDFGQVICTTNKDREVFDMLIDQLPPLELNAEKAYYGGRLIFSETSQVAVNKAPKVLSNCTHLISKARGEKTDDCRDGVGVETTAQASRQIKVYAPEVTEDHLKFVRDALSLTEAQLIYLSLRN